jgi:RNA ligase (TIGR02306 family)
MRDSKFIIKTKKFNTEEGPIYSQVIAVSLNYVKEYLKNINKHVELKEGTDLTNILEIKKYIPNSSKSNSKFGKMNRSGDFPTHLVSKTDETNACFNINLLKSIKEMPYFITIKYDGSSFTALMKSNEFSVCSRNYSLKQDDDNVFWKVALKYNLKEIIENNPDIIVQGELCGPKIQSNKIGLLDYDLFIFNIISAKTKQLLPLKEMQEFCKKFNLKFVKIFEEGESFNYSIDELINISTKVRYDNKAKAEGIVVRPKENNGFNRISFKVINPEY